MSTRIGGVGMLGLSVAALISCLGCASSMKSNYVANTGPADGSQVQGLTVSIENVKDARRQGPRTYYVSKLLSKGKFDRTVVDIVREAIEIELEHTGATVVAAAISGSKALVNLECEVLEFMAIGEDVGFLENQVRFTLALRFRWTDARTGALIDTNDQVEVRIKELGARGVPELPVRSAEIKGYGEVMVQELLRAALGKEMSSLARVWERTRKAKSIRTGQ